ncbi:nucleoredoxin-like [Ruditapes philippinarum]|uniref:nucleoredoxin-like n=1 Tax=Ruditapes philippinarum TaxID=129788 RepID=UPI00295AF070|nr:nucleoredoxin-like [Ruditapes philippinarum]
MALNFGTYFDGGKVVKAGGESVAFKPEDHEVIGLYFSAHWCPPCRGFTPELAKYYNDLKAKNRTLEIIFISSDKDETAFKEYFAEMPWLALDFRHRETKNELAQKFGVSGIPTLVFLKKDGSIATTNGRGEVMSDKDRTMSWLSK